LKRTATGGERKKGEGGQVAWAHKTKRRRGERQGCYRTVVRLIDFSRAVKVSLVHPRHGVDEFAINVCLLGGEVHVAQPPDDTAHHVGREEEVESEEGFGGVRAGPDLVPVPHSGRDDGGEKHRVDECHTDPRLSSLLVCLVTVREEEHGPQGDDPKVLEQHHGNLRHSELWLFARRHSGHFLDLVFALNFLHHGPRLRRGDGDGETDHDQPEREEEHGESPVEGRLGRNVPKTDLRSQRCMSSNEAGCERG